MREKSTMTESPGIWIITEEVTETTPEQGSKSTRRSYDDPYADAQKLRTTHRQRTRLTSAELKNNMGEFLEVVEEAFERTAEKPKSQMRLEELELSIEINAEGQVSLLGDGSKAGAKGAITLKFKRNYLN